MGVYKKLILPRLLDLAMRNRRLAPYREQVIGAARGRVLEIGVGSGLNLPLYGRAVDRLCAMDPSPELLRLARAEATRALAPVSLVRASAEQLPFGDAVFDTIVMTWTLCSIANPAAALTEMRRVLKPGGLVGIRFRRLRGAFGARPPRDRSSATRSYHRAFRRKHLGHNTSQRDHIDPGILGLSFALDRLILPRCEMPASPARMLSRITSHSGTLGVVLAYRPHSSPTSTP